ncbi:conserved protein, unknown function [Plasmodium knowlesi strain H]|uniref:Coiled-coil domain-containing protein n=3 Tax=Plasmodium knowlesi TaxID=5850 RepID=A0A5K1V978_PLAKH|nr:CG6013-like protein [Plasmodium knowlesi strain H]OTN68007.1 hypothetical protein PKNOH_S04341500 [Plasmodium knowlesi]CAA9990271.1 coiled-coil domain-containing protein 124, putative [Plasmodium knowlesi strain H]SBO26757.1 conserved protein, unknown function [Plasmodium knowlesi strain H]SBO28408.1 conserved protein, unknown function [Plasmodium knowlesi strain H]VVS79745.1 coiled-coil domain-containing protein 124, putative [Plasmodium knowlesi strain H]|eukprot:XP_002258030.1 CG6013-like protein [Plasmodium knowlesi strain H]
MPQWGAGNSRAIEARMRKKMEKDKKQKELEEKKLDEYWRDDDKKAQAKIQRKMEAESKRQQKLDRKKELRELYGEEEKALKSNKESKTTNSKVTQAQILQRLIEEKKKEIQEDKKKKNNLNVHEMELEDNINHIMRDEINDYDEYINATGIDNAISALDNVSFERTKKVKVAYKKFEEENLPLIKEQYKGLKLSQFKQILWKQFKKSPDNPMNQRD